MPLREFGCPTCGWYKEIYHPSVDPDKVEVPVCCDAPMGMLWSVPKLDTSSTFKPFDYKDPDTGKTIRIDNLHTLRAVEHASLATGRNIRFDAWSANENNPDDVDGFGAPYWDGNPASSSGKGFSLMKS